MDEELKDQRNVFGEPLETCSIDPVTGFYRTGCDASKSDLTPVFQDLHIWKDEIDSLPDDALEAVIAELKRLGPPGSLGRLPGTPRPGGSRVVRYGPVAPAAPGLRGIGRPSRHA